MRGPMTDNASKLAAGFDIPPLEAWRDAVETGLGGRSIDEALATETFAGLSIKPLYTRDDLPEGPDPSGFPGLPPWLRGSRAADRAWEIRQRHDHPDPATANAQIRHDLERGVDAVTLAVDPDGAQGIAIATSGDLERVLAGVDLARTPVHLDAGATAPVVAAGLMTLIGKQGIAPKARGGFGLDPIASWAAAGRIAGGIEAALDEMAEFVRDACGRAPRMRVAAVRSRVHHSAGAGEAEELALLIATGVAYLRAMERAGIELERGAAAIEFALALDADIFLGIAKLRAARALWFEILRGCGLDRPPAMALAAESAPRMLSRRDPWVNVLRTTTAAFVAAIGGADAVTVALHTAVLGPAEDPARRLARNVAIILAEESHLCRVLDPAGGSYAVERLTRELAAAAWQRFQGIERAGGMVAALRQGLVQESIARCRERRAKALATRRLPLTGVSEFPDPEETVEATAPRAPTDHEEGTDAIEPLVAHRLAEDFEALRDRADALMRRRGHRPAVFLAALGPLAAHRARSLWVRNLLAVGGIVAVEGAGGLDIDAIVADWRASGCHEAVIVGPDALYEDHAPRLAEALKAAGVRHLVLAGRPGPEEAVWCAAGIDEFVHHGKDIVAFLNAMLERMEADR